ncbi:MAG: hypothetical protein GTN86_00360, partial [Xanthomonadales bacterium]|nr:hypothetical protein [Xanthomonadales bacterium]NIP76714.1 hypothetical protein [Xanthomonadales bacterium]NIQ34394.1 hypothetical protein [Xanthomonadales bacterium]NIS54922.1 hypothetical protein [Stutzerimonas stutzeri]
ELADRAAPAVWAERGKADMWQRARVKARETLATHYPEYLSKQADVAIRDRYGIFLEPAAMRPGG